MIIIIIIIIIKQSPDRISNDKLYLTATETTRPSIHHKSNVLKIPALMTSPEPTRQLFRSSYDDSEEPQ